MAYKDKAAQREAARLRMQKMRKGVTETGEGVTETPANVTPNVTPDWSMSTLGHVPTMADVIPDGIPPYNPNAPTMEDIASGKAWAVLSGPYKGQLRWHGPLAQSWKKQVPCQLVDGICVAEHYEGRHITPAPPAPTSLPMVRFIKANPANLSKLQRIAGSLGKLASEVRFGLDGPTFEEIGETIGIKPGVFAK